MDNKSTKKYKEKIKKLNFLVAKLPFLWYNKYRNQERKDLKMELNKYQINRIKASVIEDVAETLLSRLNRAQELLNDEQNELQEMLTRKEELSSWQLPDKEESIKRAEIYVTTWQLLLDQIDKTLCK